LIRATTTPETYQVCFFFGQAHKSQKSINAQEVTLAAEYELERNLPTPEEPGL